MSAPLSEESQKAILTIRNILQVCLIILLFALMAYLSEILQPFILAGLLALVFQPLVYKMGEKRIPSIISLPIVGLITLGVVAVIGIIIGETAISVSSEGEYLLERLTTKMQAIFLWLATTFNFEPDITELFDSAMEYVNISSVSSTVSGIAVGIGNVTGSFVMFCLFFVMLLGGLRYYKRYIYFIAGTPEKGARWLIEYEKIYVKIIRYLSTKTYVSLITGLLVFFVCIIFDVRFPAFWGFLTFIFNFIPSIGSIVATIFTALFYIIQCETVADFTFFTGLLITIQFIIGNVVEPKIMSNRLSLNTPTVLLGLFFWGFLWGPVGMMLSVPLFVMIRIILEDIPSLAFLGRMMGSSTEAPPKKKKIKKDKALEDKEISEKEEI